MVFGLCVVDVSDEVGFVIKLESLLCGSIKATC